MLSELDIAPTSLEEAQARLAKLRAELKAQGLHGFLVPRADEYQNEYAPAHTMRLAWISGFTGSAGFAIVLLEEAAFFTDSRYTVQAEAQLSEDWQRLSVPQDSIAGFLKKHAGLKIGYDPKLHTKSELAPLKAAHANLVALSENPLDKVWENQPEWPVTPAVPHPIEYAGKESADKRAEITQNIDWDAALITSPASIAWALNIRGQDVACTPLCLSTALIHANGHVDWFVDPAKLSPATIEHLGNEVSCLSETELEGALNALTVSVLVDPSSASEWHFSSLSRATIKEGRAPCTLPKACKNDVELQGTRKAHIRDGLALTKFLHWLDGRSGITELEAAEKLTQFRQETGVLKDLSFDVISASGPNAALPHYRVTASTNRALENGDIYLVDSGGQYLDGTTDVTRTIMMGEPSEEIIHRNTCVLKGMISLSLARFPMGTGGAALDAFARQALWAAGLDFGHGTGHGVGSYLSVHEGPQGISPRASEPLLPGMIVSNEPGYYKEGHYGIRIENLVAVTGAQNIRGGETPMLGFETLTFAPIDKCLIDKALLSADEVEWLNAYHARVYDLYADELEADAREWLKEATAEL